MTEMKKRIIAKSSDYKKQIEILKTESQKRFGGTVFIEELDQIDHFLATKFCSAKNADEIKAFRENMILGINEIYNSLQSMSIDYELKIEELLSPKYMPIGNDFGHEFANLHSAIFVKNPKPYFAKELTEPLKKYIEFEYETADELYWLIIIALNAAQSDLQKENKHVQTELDKALSEFEDPMATASNNSP